MSTGLLNQLESYFSDVDTGQGPVSPDRVAELIDQVRELPTPVPVRNRPPLWVAAAAFAIVLVLVGGLVLLAPFGGNSVAPADQLTPTVPPTTIQPESDGLVSEAETAATEQVLPTTDLVSLGSPVDVVPVVMTFGEDLSVTWIQLVPGSVGEPFGVFETPDGGLAAVGIDEHLAELTILYSADGWHWTEYPTHDAFFSEHSQPWSQSEWAAVWTDYETPPDGSVAELSNGLLISDMEVSTNDGATWFAIPDHPDDDGPFGFSFHGTAGDLVYHSNEDGLWIGYIE